MKKTDYTIVKVPDALLFECPYCNNKNYLDYSYAIEKCDARNLYRGNCKEKITCDHCEKEVELADVEIDW